MSDNFSVVIRLYRSKSRIIPKEFFRVYGKDRVKRLHKELAETQRLVSNENGMRMPSYSDTSRLCDFYGHKIDKEEFEKLSLSGELIQEWTERSKGYGYEEYKLE